MPTARTKIHQIRYVPGAEQTTLAISTEDGRIIFYATQETEPVESKAKSPLPACKVIAQLRTPTTDGSNRASRVKDFAIIESGESGAQDHCIVAASSDGAVRFWSVSNKALMLQPTEAPNGSASEDKAEETGDIGRLLGTYETGHRITCMGAFVMGAAPEAQPEEVAAPPSDSDSDSD